VSVQTKARKSILNNKYHQHSTKVNKIMPPISSASPVADQSAILLNYLRVTKCLNLDNTKLKDTFLAKNISNVKLHINSKKLTTF